MLINATTYTYDASGVLKNGVKIYLELLLAPPGIDVYDNSKVEYTSVAGLISSIKVYQGATYYIQRGYSDRMIIQIPDDAIDGYELPAIMGNDNVPSC